MKTRTIKVYMKEEPEHYDELYSAMMEHREYEGCYVMQYSELQENGQMVAIFMLRYRNNKESLPE